MNDRDDDEHEPGTHADPPAVVALEIESQTLVGQPGFFAIRRARVRNVRSDGTKSQTYECDAVDRALGIDAVVVAIWCRRADGGVDVLLRTALRPALALGRPPERLPVPDRHAYVTLLELVAGIVEREDHGLPGIRQRAAIEVHEEAGLLVDAEDVVLLGAGTFPSPGTMPEKYWLCAVEVPHRSLEQPALGDGSPFEEGGRLRWFDLDEAIALAYEGALEDAKTELTLRRLRDFLNGRLPR